MKELDLHGITYDEAMIEVEDFVCINEPPYEIITGNSILMQEVVYKVLGKYHLSGHYMGNPGAMTVTEHV